MTTKAALYARYSTDQQKESSIEDQFRDCERTALSHEFVVVARFEDRGISGGTADRPGYQTLLTLARAHAFDVIVAEDVSRLWRSRSEYGPRSAELEDLGINLVTCSGDDTRRDGYGLVLGMKSVWAEYARREISYRTKRGLAGRAIAGQPTGCKCYGYTNGPVAIQEAEAAIIRRIFDLAFHGMGAEGITTALQQDAIPAPRGLKWSSASVDRILRNPRYTGQVIWGKTESRRSAANSRHKTHTARKGGPLVARFDAALQIIPQELFDEVQKKRACRTFRPKA